MSILDSLRVEVDGEPINLNQSRVQTFLRCKRKYGWGHHENLVPDRPQYALEFGTAVHKVLAAVKAKKVPEDRGVEYFIKEFDKQLGRQHLTEQDRVIRDEHVELAIRMIPAYYATYREESNPWKALGIEVSGRVEVGTGTNVFLIFRTDELVTQNKMLWIVDHKTAAKMDERMMLKYEMDLQMTAYVYAVTKRMRIRCSGVIVNVLVKTIVPQFHRERFIKSDEELEEFEREFVEIAREIKLRHKRVAEGEDWKTVFYKNTNECFAYGTCWYRDLCLKDNEIRRLAFRARDEDYVDNPEKFGILKPLPGEEQPK